MDREEIIKMAREVGYPLVEYEGTPYIPPLLEMLLKTVAESQRTWVSLTDEEIYSLADSLEIWNEDDEKWILDPNTFARAIEAKLKEST